MEEFELVADPVLDDVVPLDEVFELHQALLEAVLHQLAF